MKIFTTKEISFKKTFQQFLKKRRHSSSITSKEVCAILEAIRSRGDDALLSYGCHYDGLPDVWNYDRSEIASFKLLSPQVEEALTLSAGRIAIFHDRQMPRENFYCDAMGVSFRQIWRPIASAGIYAPCGRACYPSSLLMAAVTANVAGVKRVVVISPPQNGIPSPLILAAARIANVDEFYCVGGAHGIGALAFGTESISPVEHISGPGNLYITEAKRQVSSHVGIDMPAGPSEVTIVFDGVCPCEWIVADMLAQAEHDPQAQAIIILTDHKLLEPLKKALTQALQKANETTTKSIKDWSACVIIKEQEDIASVINCIAPEHLELCVKHPEDLLPSITNSGTIFLGAHTPEALGDYVLGSNHILPTSGSARYCSGLSVYHFLKRITVASCGQKAFEQLAPATMTLAKEEGLPWHARSIELRLKALSH